MKLKNISQSTIGLDGKRILPGSTIEVSEQVGLDSVNAYGTGALEIILEVPVKEVVIEAPAIAVTPLTVEEIKPEIKPEVKPKKVVEKKK